jgi:hypothetical protein
MKANPLADVPTLVDNPDVPVLAQWVSLADAGAELGWSRQYMHKLARLGRLVTLHRIGNTRPVFVLDRTEVDALHESKSARTRARLDAAAEEVSDES